MSITEDSIILKYCPYIYIHRSIVEEICGLVDSSYVKFDRAVDGKVMVPTTKESAQTFIEFYEDDIPANSISLTIVMLLLCQIGMIEPTL